MWVGFCFAISILVGLLVITFLTTSHSSKRAISFAQASHLSAEQSLISLKILDQFGVASNDELTLQQLNQVDLALAYYTRVNRKLTEELQSLSLDNSLASDHKLQAMTEELGTQFISYINSLLVQESTSHPFHQDTTSFANLSVEFSHLNENYFSKLLIAFDGKNQKFIAFHRLLEKRLYSLEQENADISQKTHTALFTMSLFVVLLISVLIFLPAHIVSSKNYRISQKRKKQFRNS